MSSATLRATLGVGLAGALAALAVAGPARAHDWEELQGAASVEQARLALDVARRVVDDAAEGYAGPRLAPGASANDWLRWFTGVADLASRAGQRRLAERLVGAGFVAPGLEEFAVEEWRHVAGHVAFVFDAERRGPSRAEADAAAERLSTLQPGDDIEAHLEAARLSYLISLAGVTESEREMVAPLGPAIEALIEQAQGTGGQP